MTFSEFLKVAAKFAIYTLTDLWFYFKKKMAEQKRNTKIIVDEEKIRAEMEDRKKSIPNSWDAVNRMRKTNKN